MLPWGLDQQSNKNFKISLVKYVIVQTSYISVLFYIPYNVCI